MPSSALRRIWPLILYGQILGGALLAFPCAAPGESKPDDYLIKTWDTEDSLSGSTVTSVEQTRDGYLWVGTYVGLTRFDGVRSVTFDSQNTPALSHSRIQGLYLDGRGGLWINTYRGGLTSWHDGVFRREWPDQSSFDLHTTMVSSSSNQVTFVTQYGNVLRGTLTDSNTQWSVLEPPRNTRPRFQCVDGDGTLWLLSRDSHILCVRDGQYEELPPDRGLGGKKVLTVSAGADGRIWAGAENEIACWNGNRFEDLTPTNQDQEKTFDPIMIFPTSRGALWVLANDRLREQVGRKWVAEATEWHGLLGPASQRTMGAHEDDAGGIWFNHYGNGVFYITPNGRYLRFTEQEGLPGDRVGAWFQDRDGDIWLGVDRGGLVQLARRRFQAIGAAEGLPAGPALSVCQDGQGTVWIGSPGGGLSAYRQGQLTNYAVSDAASGNFVFSIFPQINGGLWLSAGDGEDLFQFRDGQLERSPWELHGVKSLLLDHAGRLWAGTKVNMGWYSAAGRRTFGASDGVAESAVRALAEAPDGAVWAGADDGTLYRCEPSKVQAYQPQDAIGPRPIWSLFVDPDGTVWAGTFRGGLLRFKNGQFSRITTRQGLPMDVITQILEDKKGRIWLGTHQGICCVEKSALEACADGESGTMDVVRHLSGLPSLECSDGYQPACWPTRDGRLWFTTAKGVVSVDPDELAVKSLPPPVVIEDLVVDGQSVPLENGKAVIPPGHEQFEFHFTALSFDTPELSRFRYRIEGLDKSWVEAGTRRSASYGHLAPKHYRFQVIACNSDGVWNRSGALVDFIVQPYFYETPWFLGLMSVLVLGTVAVAVRAAATRKYRQALARLAQQHAIEKDRSRIAKDIHDDIGAGLTQITLLSELGRREPSHAGAQLERISEAARDLTRSMDEIVWAVDPQRDTLSSLMDYISAYAEDFLRMARVRCRMDFPAALPALPIAAEVRYNLFLALKEILNNIVKHAQASEVRLQLQLNSKTFTLVVEDNGHGFEPNHDGKTSSSPERHHSGRGLSNLKRRLETIGGQYHMQSALGKGTHVEMVITLDHTSSPVMAIGQEELSK